MPDPADRIARRDELLELLYWLEGERIRGSASAAGIARFVAKEEREVRQTLDDLVRRGDVHPPVDGNGEYRLTETGRGEAARRFAAEFAPMLAQGHGECNDPDCDCHTDPAGAAECHRHRT